jgi:protein-tyrosine-phosphatase
LPSGQIFLTGRQWGIFILFGISFSWFLRSWKKRIFGHGQASCRQVYRGASPFFPNLKHCHHIPVRQEKLSEGQKVSPENHGQQTIKAKKTMLPGVLFICLGNSCRSIMAEALARNFFQDSVKTGSAGINPLGYIAEETLQVLVESGITTAGLWSKGLAEIDVSEFHLIVNLTTYSLDSYLPRAFHGRSIRYPVADPFGGSLAGYRDSREAIRQFIVDTLPQYLANL